MNRKDKQMKPKPESRIGIDVQVNLTVSDKTTKSGKKTYAVYFSPEKKELLQAMAKKRNRTLHNYLLTIINGFLDKENVDGADMAAKIESHFMASEWAKSKNHYFNMIFDKATA